MKTFTCPQCGKRAKSRAGLMGHIRFRHTDASADPTSPPSARGRNSRMKVTYAVNGLAMTIRQIRTLADNVGGMKKLGELVEALA